MMQSTRLFVRTLLFTFGLSVTLTGGAAFGATSAGDVDGTVSSADGAPIRDAFVSLQGGGAGTSGRTDATGHFSVGGVRAGTYAIRVSAAGYDALAPRTIDVHPAQTTDVALALVRSSSSLATIGRVQAAGGEALSTSSAPISTLNPQAYAARGYTRVSDLLQDDIATTLVHPVGGSTVLPTSVALRGPDPTETLVDIDGHQVNNGNTGDFDLSLLDPADYAGIELVKGISPSSLVGPDTIDGAINIRTLEPTRNPHALVRLSGGSFNAFGQTLQATGTQGRLGYAFSVHRTTTSGDVNGAVFDAGSASTQTVGSSVDGSTLLGKLRYAFGRDGDGYAELSFHDQHAFRDFSAALSSYADPVAGAPAGLPVVNSFAGTALASHNAGYGLDVRVPLGSRDDGGTAPTSLLYRHYTSLVSQSITGPGAQTSPYLYNDRDLIGDDSLEFNRQFSNGSLTVQYAVRNEKLDTDFVSGVVNDQALIRRTAFPLSIARRPLDNAGDAPSPVDVLALGQTQRSAVLRYNYDPTAHVHLTGAAYYSDYSIFGHSLDPRLGAVYTPDARTAVRFSVGTTYQAPQLPELFVPATLPQAVGGYVSVGNPNLKPDHATEYGLGASRVLENGAHRTEVSVDLYRVNLRNPASTYLPPLDDACGSVAAGGDGSACPLSFPVNAGDAVYRGVELSASRRLTPFVLLRAGYAVRSAFLTSVPASIQDGTLVVNEQTLGLPLHKATLAISGSAPHGLTFGAGVVYEGAYNELNEPPFATLDASIGYRWPMLELVVSGTNLTDVYDTRFTRSGAGVPYGGLAGPIATDAYALARTSINVSLAHRF